MGFFLIMFLIVAGYFVVLGLALKRLDNSRAIFPLAACVLLIYGCIVGMAIVLGEYLGEAGLVIYMAAILYVIIFWIWQLYSAIKNKVRPQFRIGVLLTFFAYILAVLYVTTFMRKGGSNTTVQMEVMNWVRKDGVVNFHHVLQNIAMFVPLGLLFPFLTDSDSTIGKKILLAVSFALLFSVTIETGQFILRSGTCDIDDILANTLGGAIGAAGGVAALWKGNGY